MTSEQTAEPIEVTEPAILLNLNQLYRPDMTAEELYKATRGFWVLGADRDRAQIALAVHRGVVREVYDIWSWFPAETLLYKSRDAAPYTGSRRWEFEGAVAHDIRDRYVGRFVGTGGQNPVRYANVK